MVESPTARPRDRVRERVERELDAAFRRVGEDMRDFKNAPRGPLSGVPAAVERVKADDSPLTVDSVLLEPGEVAVFDASGALVVWFPAPDSPDGQMICQKAVTVLTYADMPQATPRMRDQLRLLKGGRREG